MIMKNKRNQVILFAILFIFIVALSMQLASAATGVKLDKSHSDKIIYDQDKLLPTVHILHFHVTNTGTEIAENVSVKFTWTSGGFENNNTWYALTTDYDAIQEISTIAPGETVDVFYQVWFLGSNKGNAPTREYRVDFSGVNINSASITGTLSTSASKPTGSSMLSEEGFYIGRTEDLIVGETITFTLVSRPTANINWFTPEIYFDIPVLKLLGVNTTNGTHTVNTTAVYRDNPSNPCYLTGSTFTTTWTFEIIGDGNITLYAALFGMAGNGGEHLATTLDFPKMNFTFHPDMVDFYINKDVTDDSGSQTIVKADVGDIIGYNITIRNDGPAYGKNVTVVDKLDTEYLEFFEYEVNGNFAGRESSTYDYISGEWFVAERFDVGEEATLTIYVRVNKTIPGGKLSNMATVTSDNKDNINTTVNDTANITIVNRDPSNSTIEVPGPGEAKFNGTYRINGTVHDGNDTFGDNPIPNVNITVIIDNETFYDVETDEDGNWYVNFTPKRGGTHNVTVTWDGDDDYRPFTNVTSFDVEKLPTNSTIDVPENGTVIGGDKVNITGVLTDQDPDSGLPIGKVNITVKITDDEGNVYDEFDQITDDDGGWNITDYIPKIIEGNITVVVTWDGDERYHNFTNKTSFDIHQIPTNSTIIVDETLEIGNETNITGVLWDHENDEPIADKNITVWIDGELYNVTTNSTGGWNITNYTPKRAGKDIVIIVNWTGNDRYKPFTNTTTFDVLQSPSNSTIEVPSEPVEVGTELILNGTLHDYKGHNISNTKINVTITNEKGETKKIENVTVDENGDWSVEYMTNATGNVHIKVEWPGNENYYPFVNETDFQVNKSRSNSTIIIPDEGTGLIDIDRNNTITGVLHDYKGHNITSTTISVIISIYDEEEGWVNEYENETVTVDENGSWSIIFETKYPSLHVINVTWIGSDTHDGFINTTEFTVANWYSNSTIKVPDDPIVGESYNITGHLHDTMGHKINNTKIDVTVNGKTYYNVTVDDNGDWFVPELFTPENNSTVIVNVSYTDGGTKYRSSSNKTEFTPRKLPTNSTIEVPDYDVIGGDTIQINGTAYNTENKTDVLNKTEITVTLYDENGDRVYEENVTTDDDGSWNIEYTPTTEGNITVKVTWDGTNRYHSFTNTTQFKVIKIPTNSTINVPENITGGDNITINGTVRDPDNETEVINNTNITIRIIDENNETIFEKNITTDDDGNWNITYPEIKEGNYTIEVTWKGNDRYKTFTNKTNFKVTKLPTNSTINVPENITGGDNITINGTVRNPDNETEVINNTNITIRIIDENNETIFEKNITTDDDGNWNITYPDAKEGNYTIEVIWKGNDRYKSFTNKTNFNVTRLPTNSTIEVSEPIIVNRNVTINGTVYNTDNETDVVKNINITIKIIGEDGETVFEENRTTGPNGEWNITYTPDTEGNFTIEVIWEDGNDRYKPFKNSTIYEVGKVPTNSTIINPEHPIVSTNVTIEGVLRDYDGETIKFTNITITISNGDSEKIYNVTTGPNGEWSVEDYYIENDHTIHVEANWTGDDYYRAFVNGSSFDVEKMPTNSTIIVPENAKAGQTYTINGTFHDEDDDGWKNLTGRALYIDIDGTIFHEVSGPNGEWSVEYTCYDEKNVTVKVMWDDTIDGNFGNSTHYGFINETVYEVTKIKTNTTIDVPETILAGTNVTINGTAIDEESGKPIANTNITVIINGTPHTVKTDDDGNWNITYNTTDEGFVEIEVTWEGNRTHKSFSNKTNTTIYKIPTNSTIIIPPDVKIGNETTITGYLHNYTGGRLPSTNITVIVTDGDGNVIHEENITTGPNGEWNVTITPNTTGNFKISVEWEGNTSHRNFTNVTNFDVSMQISNSTIVTPDNAKVGQIHIVRGVAHDYKGNVLASTNITVKVGNQTYNVTTDPNGGWSVNYTHYVEGSVGVTVSWPGNSTHMGHTNVTTYTVSKIATHTTIVVPKEVDLNQNINITGVLTDEYGNRMPYTKLNVTVNGKTYTVTTDDTGKWTLPYKPTTSGKIDVTVSYPGNDTYYSSDNKTSFNVKKGTIKSDVTYTENGDGSVTITTRVTDKNGEPVKNQPVTIMKDGKVIAKTRTDGNGLAKITLPRGMANGKISVVVDKDHYEPTSNDIDLGGNETEATGKGVKAYMKNTGIPIVAMILVLLSSLGLMTIGRKK